MIIAIDPGNKESGYCILDDYRPVEFGKVENDTLQGIIRSRNVGKAIIEMVASYGMPVGETVFDTCVWIGRFTQVLDEMSVPIEYVKRKQYVTDLCGSAKAKDSNVIQYLVDRFAKDVPNHGKGSVKNKGWFYGFSKDIWQAYAIGVWFLDGNGKEIK